MLYIKLFIEREKNIGQSAPECPFNSSNENYKSHEITEKHNDDMADLISVGGHQDADDDLCDENSQQQQRVLRNTNTYTNRNRFI